MLLVLQNSFQFVWAKRLRQTQRQVVDRAEPEVVVDTEQNPRQVAKENINKIVEEVGDELLGRLIR